MIFIRFFMLALATMFVGGVIAVKWYRNRRSSQLNEELSRSLAGMQAPPAKPKRQLLGAVSISFKRPLLGEDDGASLRPIKPEESDKLRAKLQGGLADLRRCWTEFGISAAGYYEANRRRLNVYGQFQRLALPTENVDAAANFLERLAAVTAAVVDCDAEYTQVRSKASQPARRLRLTFGELQALSSNVLSLQTNAIVPIDVAALARECQEFLALAYEAHRLACEIYISDQLTADPVDQQAAEVSASVDTVPPPTALIDEVRSCQSLALTSLLQLVELVNAHDNLTAQVKETGARRPIEPSKPEAIQVDAFLEELTVGYRQFLAAARGRQKLQAELVEVAAKTRRAIEDLEMVPRGETEAMDCRAVVKACRHLKTLLECRLDSLLKSVEEAKKEDAADTVVPDPVSAQLRRGDENNFIAALRAQSRTLVMALAARNAANQKSATAKEAIEPVPGNISPSSLEDEQAISQYMRSLNGWSLKWVKAVDQSSRASVEVNQRQEQLKPALERLLKTFTNVEAAGLAEGRTDDLLVACAVARQVYGLEVKPEPATKPAQERDTRSRSYDYDRW